MEELTKRLLAISEQNHNEEVVLYGIQVIADGILSILGLLILGGILGKMEYTILFIIFSYLISRSTGGYHAQTRAGCALLTLGMYLIAVYVPEVLWMKVSLQFTGIMLLIILLLIWFLAPVEHPNKPLLPEFFVRNRYISRIYVVIVSVLIVYLNKKCNMLGMFLLVNLGEVAVSMTAGKIIYTMSKGVGGD